MAMLDKQRTEKLTKAATVLQRHARGWLARMHYEAAVVSIVRMQVRGSLPSIPAALSSAGSTPVFVLQSGLHTFCSLLPAFRVSSY